MKTVDKRLTTIVWYAAALSLSSAFAWKSRIKVLRKINPAGAGYLSFDPSRPGNSLTDIATGDVLTLDATGIVASDAATFFDVDNGEPPTSRDVRSTMRFEAAAGPATVRTYARQLFSKRVSPTYETGMDVAKFSVNGGPYVDYYTATQQAEALPASDFAALGPGMTLQPQLTLPDLNDPVTIEYTINSY